MSKWSTPKPKKIALYLDSLSDQGYMRPMTDRSDTNLSFMKMHGLGNDFVVLDARDREIDLSDALVRNIADRHRGVGFDQLAVIRNGSKDAHLEFYNADGSMSSACGNATRCIARYLMTETGQSDLSLTTDHGTLAAKDMGEGLTSVNMGLPGLSWQDIPLSEAVDSLSLPIDGAPVATGMGNPHCTFFVEDAEAVGIEERGALIEHHPLFPKRTNVQFASLLGENHLRMRVWERGVGVTLASGSSSCATVVAAARRGLTGKSARIDLDGGTMHVEWRKDGVWLTGPTMHVFSGSFTPDYLENAR